MNLSQSGGSLHARCVSMEGAWPNSQRLPFKKDIACNVLPSNGTAGTEWQTGPRECGNSCPQRLIVFPFHGGRIMKMFVQPGKRDGVSKVIFDGALQEANIVLEEGQVVLSIIADDIYTKNATQRYTVVLDPEDQACITQASCGDD